MSEDDRSAALQPGATIAQYRVLSELGRGGMGVVYLAEDTQLKRKVALKVLPPDVAAAPDRLKRFEHEALAASSLSHPNIMVVYGIGVHDGAPFIAAEYIDGATLRVLLSEGPLPVEQALDVATQIANALAAAHKAGIAHRDIKPENIMLREDGYVKLLDFGLVKLGEAGPRDLTRTAGANTQTGDVLGTVAYMSPEQVRGLPLDTRTDLFSLGVVLYEMISGRLPHQGSSSLETASQILTREPVPVSRLSATMPPQVDAVVSKLLRKDRDQRYQAASEVVADLKAIRHQLELRPRRSAGGRIRTAALVAALVGLTATAGYWIAPRSSPDGLASVRSTTQVTDNGQSLLAALSPDGRYMAYVAGEGIQQALWVRQVSSSSNVQLAAPARAQYWGLTFAPDGAIYFVRVEPDAPRRGVLYRTTLLGGEPQPVVHDVSSGVAFSPDGSRLAFIRAAADPAHVRLMVAGADGSGERSVMSSAFDGLLPQHTPSWAPDGATIASARSAPGAPNAYEILGVSVADGSARRLYAKNLSHVKYLLWEPSGRVLLVAGQEKATAFWPQILAVDVRSETVRLLTDQQFAYPVINRTRDGDVLAAVQQRTLSNIWVAPLDGSARPAQVPSQTGHVQGKNGLTWLPDGRIAYAANINGDWAIVASAIDGSGQRLLSTDVSGDFDPSAALGPDLVFASNRGGSSRRIWRMDLTGANARPLSAGVMDWLPHLSSDGAWVVYASPYEGKRTIWRVRSDGRDAAPLNREPANMPALSPDGRRVVSMYYGGPAGAPPRLAIMSFETGAIERLIDLPPRAETQFLSLRWLPDGRHIAYVATVSGVSNVMALPIDGGSPRPLTHFDALRIFKFDISRDGRQIVCARGNDYSDIVLIKGIDGR